MNAIVRVRSQIGSCRECGRIGYVHETPINHDGPYCAGCIEEIAETEEQDNGQFGVGA